MNDKTLILSAPRPETIRRLLLFLLLTMVGIAALWGLDLAAAKGIFPPVVSCILFVPVIVVTACLFCGAADAVICLCDRRAVVLTETTIKVYNLEPFALSEIDEITVCFGKKNIGKKLILTLKDGKKITVLRRTVNLPLCLLKEAIMIRK